jgi:hypothetical protein
VPEVPKLAEQVITLKKELDTEKERVEMLSRYLEDPEMTDKRKRKDLGGEDPDQEALQAKI